MDGQYWIGLLQIMLIDLVMSGDNAVVIGMACRGLSRDKQRLAIIYGTTGAILLRVALTGLTTWMLDIPLVKAVGGILLLWISYKLLVNDDEEMTEISHSRSLGQAVKTIILADVIMSLDNVLAVGGAAHGDFKLVFFGLVFSIPLLMWGSSWIARILYRFPALSYFGSGILAYTATEMCLEDPYVWKISNKLLFNHGWTPVLIALMVMAFGRLRRAH